VKVIVKIKYGLLFKIQDILVGVY